MPHNFYSQPSYRVGDNCYVITVSESGDFPGENVVVFTKDVADKGHFGNISLDMPVEFMRLLAKTILKVCDEVEENK